MLTDPKVAGPLMMSVWQRAAAMADKYNEPGRFTTLIGFEWTPTPGGDNLHRNVLLRDGQDRASQVFPFSSWNSEDPEQLWAWMESYEQRTGGRALAIPHNGNLSNGRMFAAQRFDGTPLTRDYAERRQRWEPIQEIVQSKGASESHPKLSPNDEFLDFGIAGWELGNLTLSGSPLTRDMMPTSFVRAGFMRGLEHEAKLGVNPFKSGIIGSFDAHNSLPFVDEDNFFGKFPGQEPSPDRWKQKSSLGEGEGDARVTWQYLAAGYAAVWATENTREAVFDAMQRRETYGTSGTRMTVRFFGGYDFTPDDAQSRYLAEAGYTKGVPMGGDLKPAAAGKVPTFLVAALKDPQGANLDRIQVVKGWLDASGKAQEKVYDVVLGWQPQARQGRQAAAGRRHGRRRPGHVHQHHRCRRTGGGVEGPGLPAGPARLLLRPRHRDSDPPLDGVRPGAFRREDERRRPDEAAGTRVDVADLVLADLSRPIQVIRRLLRESRCTVLLSGTAA